LLMMIARHTGYKPGVFSHFVANEQIYDRHMDAANEMLSRQLLIERDEYFDGCKKNPMLIINPEKTNFYDFTIDDFTMEDYKPLKPQLKLELGI